MLNIGMTELLIFGIIALLILGPDKLPEAVRFVGKWYGKVTRMVSNIQNDFDRELRLSELREQMQLEMKRIQELEAKMHAQMSELKKPIDTSATSVQFVNKNKPFADLHFQAIKTPELPPCVIHPKKMSEMRANATTFKTLYAKQSYTDMKVAV